MKIYLKNENTCTRVKLFGEDVKNTFLCNGHFIVEDMSKADWIIVNTCSFLKVKEDYFLNLLKNIYKNKLEKQKIAIIGCLAGVNKSSVLEIGDIQCFGRNIDEIKKYFNLKNSPKTKASSVCDKLPFKKKTLYYFNKIFLHSKHIEYRLKRNKVCYLQISTGCMGRCTYCSERFTTKLHSRPLNEIIDAINDGISRGYKLFALNSDDASAYGKDIGTNLETLLEAVTNIDKDFYITIPEFNPNGITPKVKECLKNKKFLYLTLPIQSGSQKILDSMQRPYKIKDVVSNVKEIKKNNKKIKINTHIIVGFPGETDDDFEQTKSILKTKLFDRVKVFKYSERPNTMAKDMPDKVDEETKKKRAKDLLKLMKKINIKKFSLTNLILNKEQIK